MTNHYAHIRYLGLEGRVSGDNEAPLRIVNGKIGVKRRGVILPVTGLDAEGYALVNIGDKSAKLADTPRTAEGGYDYEALTSLYPSITDPWSVPALAGLKTRGPKPSAEPKAPAAPKAVAKALAVDAKPAKQAAAKAEPKAQLTEDMVITYLAGLSPKANQALIERLVAAKTKK